MTEYKNTNPLHYNATAVQLEQAAAFNHTELFCLDALTAGGKVHRTEGVVWTHGGENVESMIAFPTLREDRASDVLDEIIQYYLNHPPKGVGCWSLDPPQPKDLGIRLLARGFQPGWFPNWMSLDLRELQLNHPVPDGLQVTPDNTTLLSEIKGLPYSTEYIEVFSKQPKDGDSYLQRFIAILNGKIVAHCGVLLTKGELATAGVYHVGVLPGVRMRGIGKAVVGAACLHAKNLGYRYAVLNGTGHRMYELLGFKKLGIGHTWWLVTSRLIAHPPSKNEIFLAEAIGRGDAKSLERIGNNTEISKLQSTLTNGMTLMQLAVHCQQPVSAEWLISRGIAINVMQAWDLGWRDVATTILNEQPDQVNMRHGEWGLTMLHMAADRDDTELARLAISSKPNLEIKDTLYNATALDWAKHLQKEKIIQIIESY